MAAPTYEEIMKTTPDSRKKQALKQILAWNNRCQIWVGGSTNDRFDYPYRLVPSNRITERMRKASTQLMIDSNIGDEETSNKEVLENAIEYNAQFVVPKDYTEDQVDDPIQATYESAKEFDRMWQNSECEATVIYPLQPPHDEHYERHKDFYSQVSHLAVGGMRDSTPEEQIEAAKAAREAVGPYKELHGFGMGASEHVIKALWENHNLLDSIDTSTYERLPGRGKIAGATWEQIGDKSKGDKDCSCPSFEMPSGDDIFSLNAIATEFMVYMANYQLGPLDDTFTKNRVAPTEDSQMTLNNSWKTSGDASKASNKNDSAEQTETPV